MEFSEIWDRASAAIEAVPRSDLLMVTLAAMVAGWFGTALLRKRVGFGRIISTASTIILAAVLATVVLQLSRLDPRIDLAVPGLDLPEQVVEGGETRIELSRDGHFWLQASINGEEAPFLVDTGATLTAISPDLAQRAGLEPRSGGIPIQLETANGAILADMTAIDSLTFGNVNASGIDAVIAPNLGKTNVIGMNVLSRLESWRVEGTTMILVPKSGDRTD